MTKEIDMMFLRKLLLENNIDPSNIALIDSPILAGRPIEVIIVEVAGIKIVKRLTGGND